MLTHWSYVFLALTHRYNHQVERHGVPTNALGQEAAWQLMPWSLYHLESTEVDGLQQINGKSPGIMGDIKPVSHNPDHSPNFHHDNIISSDFITLFKIQPNLHKNVEFVIQNWITIGSRNSLLPDGTKPLYESILINLNDQWDLVEFIWGQFHRKCSDISLKTTKLISLLNLQGLLLIDAKWHIYTSVN